MGKNSKLGHLPDDAKREIDSWQGKVPEPLHTAGVLSELGSPREIVEYVIDRHAPVQGS